MINLKPCPFCGSTNLDYSIKIKGHFEIYYHAVIYCKNCRTYGPRVITQKVKHADYTGRDAIETDIEYKEKAIQAWNKRSSEL